MIKVSCISWLAIDNLDELPMRIVEPLVDIAIKAWNNEEGSIVNPDGSYTEKKLIALCYKQRLERYDAELAVEMNNHDVCKCQFHGYSDHCGPSDEKVIIKIPWFRIEPGIFCSAEIPLTVRFPPESREAI